MTERSHDVRESSGFQNALDFAHDADRIADVFENRVAFHALEQIRGKWELFGIGDHVHAWEAKQVDVHVSIHGASGSSDVKVPPAQRRVDLLGRLGRIRDKRSRRLEQTVNAILPTSGRAPPVRVEHGPCVRAGIATHVLNRSSIST
jgi:hypothetical protein